MEFTCLLGKLPPFERLFWLGFIINQWRTEVYHWLKPETLKFEELWHLSLPFLVFDSLCLKGTECPPVTQMSSNAGTGSREAPLKGHVRVDRTPQQAWEIKAREGFLRREPPEIQLKKQSCSSSERHALHLPPVRFIGNSTGIFHSSLLCGVTKIRDIPKSSHPHSPLKIYQWK